MHCCLAFDYVRFDCVFPTRTARFGVALVPSGSLRLKAKEHAQSFEPVDKDCACLACREYTRAYLHILFKENCALAAQLLTMHNIAYMMRLMRSMREVSNKLKYDMLHIATCLIPRQIISQL